mgnify:CR=1 FL=1
MSMSKRSFKDDIESAERMTLIVSWVGVVSALVVIAYALWGI